MELVLGMCLGWREVGVKESIYQERKLEVNTKVDLREEVGCEDERWMEMAQDHV
jgi:hypothetical protein